MLLARPRLLHLEHQDDGGRRRDRRDARRDRWRGSGPSGWSLVEEATEADGAVEAWFSVRDRRWRAASAICASRASAAWTLLTTMPELKGYEEKTRRRRVRQGVDARRVQARQNWLEPQEERSSGAGLRRAALLRHHRRRAGRHRAGRAAASGSACRPSSSKRMRAPATPGAIATSRSCLHDPVWYDHLPYLPFPDHWPVFAPKDKIGDWLEIYAEIMELNYWASTECLNARYDAAQQRVGGAGRARTANR